MTNFRADINGLRAWAVVAVILFHFSVPGFAGGFIGVDVFFVISGFLMTGIILGRLAPDSSTTSHSHKPFSLFDFYLARARRILPALMVLCAVLLVFGWFTLPTIDYRMLATHAITALAFISNIKFWREAGYFDAASHEKLLLHTWSLSVEWQFYVLFPIVLIALWKLWPNRRFIGFMLLLGFAVSLGISVIATRLTPGAAFYLLPTRAWEMIAGGLVYFYASQYRPSKTISTSLEITGFILILASILLFDSSTPWPGWQALIPVIGTVLVLLSSQSSSWFTSTSVAQWLGKTSYSLYLWHWPFSVILIYLGLQGQVIPIFVGLLLTLILGWASWAFVEEPARRGLIKFRAIPQTAVIGLLVLVIAAPAMGVRLQNGVLGRMPAHVDSIFAETSNRNPERDSCYAIRDTSKSCVHGSGNQLSAIVFGDSHSDSIMQSMALAAPSDSHILNWSFGGCPKVLGVQSTQRNDQACIQHLQEAFSTQKSIDPNTPIIFVERISAYIEGHNEPDLKQKSIRPDRYYFTQLHQTRSPDYYNEFLEAMVNTYCAFSEYRPVYILRPIPELKIDVPRAMGRAALLGRHERVSISMDEYEERHRIAWEAQDRAAEECGVVLLDPTPYLCSEGRCWGDVDGIPVYYDDDHLSERGGQLLIPLFQQMFE